MSDVRMAAGDVALAAYERFRWFMGGDLPDWWSLTNKEQSAWRCAAYAAVKQQQKVSRQRR